MNREALKFRGNPPLRGTRQTAGMSVHGMNVGCTLDAIDRAENSRPDEPISAVRAALPIKCPERKGSYASREGRYRNL